MFALLTPVRRWLGRRLLRSGPGGSLDLSRIGAMPKRLRWPLTRDGLDPVARVGQVRATEPVLKMDAPFGLNIWLVTGYDAVREVLRDTTSYSNDIRPFVGGETDDASKQIGGLGFTDPPAHTRLRGLLTPQFTRRRLARLQPRVEEIVEERLDAVEEAGPVVDLVPTFAFPIPFQVICELLGLPVEDRERFRELGPARFDLRQGGMGALGAMSQSRGLLLDAVRRQRENPGDGLIGGIITDYGDEVDDVELAGLADGVFLGGYETSVSMLGLGTLTLLSHRETLDRLREDPSTGEEVVEELLRYLSVVQVAFPRFARHDLELGGQHIGQGDMVACSLSAANRDASFGPDADEFAPNGRAGGHFGFGHGFHRCVGAELARMELRAAFTGLARRFPTMELAAELGDLQFRDLSLVYGLDALPVRPRATATVA